MFAGRPPGARLCGGAGSLRACARRASDVRQPKRDLQTVILPVFLGAGRVVRKGDRHIAFVLSLVDALEGTERSPGVAAAFVSFAARRVEDQLLRPWLFLRPAVPRPPPVRPAVEKVVQVIAQQSAEGRGASCWCSLRIVWRGVPVGGLCNRRWGFLCRAFHVAWRMMT